MSIVYHYRKSTLGDRHNSITTTITTRLSGTKRKEELRETLPKRIPQRHVIFDTPLSQFPTIFPASGRDIEAFSRRLRAANGRGETTARGTHKCPGKDKGNLTTACFVSIQGPFPEEAGINTKHSDLSRWRDSPPFTA